MDLAVLAAEEKAREMCASGGFLALRVASHGKVRDVARRIGVSAATVSRWEHGINLPAGDKALALLRVAGEMAAEGGQ